MTGVGLLVAGVVAGAAGVQAVEALTTTFLNTGIFTVRPGEYADVFAALDDAASAGPAAVLLQVFNENGAVVQQQNVSLSPGKSTKMRVVNPGRYRLHGRVLDAPRVFDARRIIMATVEIGGDDFVFPLRPVCSIDDSVPSGRPG
jgi:hypothetical protein